MIELVVDVVRQRSKLKKLCRSAALVAFLCTSNMDKAIAEYVPLHERMTAEECIELSKTMLYFATTRIEPIIESLSKNQDHIPHSIDEDLLVRMEKLRDQTIICEFVQFELERRSETLGINFSSVSIDFSAIRSTIREISNYQIQNEVLLQRSIDFLVRTYSRLLRTLKGGSGFPDPMAGETVPELTELT